MRKGLYLALALLAIYASKAYFDSHTGAAQARAQARSLILDLEKYHNEHGLYPDSLLTAFPRRPKVDFIYEGLGRTEGGYRQYELAVGKSPKAYVYSSEKQAWQEYTGG